MIVSLPEEFPKYLDFMKENTIRKNKTDQEVVWPTTTYFTIKEQLWKKYNPKFVEITLRVRLAKAIEEGTVAEIGSIPGGKGRPQKVFALTPVTQTIIDKARQDGITLVDNYEKLIVKVLSVTNKPLKSPGVTVTEKDTVGAV